MKIKYDHMADAMYIRLKDGKTAKTKSVTSEMNVDFDAEGELLGIELLFVSDKGIDISSLIFEQSLPANYRQTLIDARKKVNAE